MTAHARPPLATGEHLRGPESSLSARLGTFRSHLVAWVAVCADNYQAAALYDALSGLSDAELHRRRLSRATLARDLTQACDRTSGCCRPSCSMTHR
jgi:hypothetical protein